MGDLSEDASDDLEGLDAAAAHVVNLLATEPGDSRFLLLLYRMCSLLMLALAISFAF